MKRIPWISKGSSVGCGLTIHSAIFQQYSDETVVRFPNLDLLPDNIAIGVFSMPSLPQHGHGIYLLAIN